MRERAQDRADRSSRSLPAAVKLLTAMLLLQGLSGVAGGFGLTADPSGRDVGLDPAWLEGSPFPDFLVPGLVLLVVLGVVPLIVAVGAWRRASWAWWGALLVGAALVIWILVQLVIVGYIPRPPLQLLYGILGMAIVGATLLPSVRRDLGFGSDAPAPRGGDRLRPRSGTRV